jgi:hypothetical protein
MKSDYKAGDTLTSETEKWILDHNEMCPFCQQGYLCEGPHGGLSINFRCNHCFSRVNWTPCGVDVLEVRTSED